MPLTPEQIAETMNALQIDTPEKLTNLLAAAHINLQLGETDQEDIRIQQEQQAATQAFEARRQANAERRRALLAQRDAITQAQG